MLPNIKLENFHPYWTKLQIFLKVIFPCNPTKVTRQKGQIQKSGLHGWNFTLGLDFLKTRRKNFDMWAPWRIAFFERFVPFKCNLHQISLAITQDWRSCIEFISVNCVKTREKRSSLKFEAETTSYIVLPFSLMRSHKIGTKNSAHKNAEDQMFDFFETFELPTTNKALRWNWARNEIDPDPALEPLSPRRCLESDQLSKQRSLHFYTSLFSIFEFWIFAFLFKFYFMFWGQFPKSISIPLV